MSKKPFYVTVRNATEVASTPVVPVVGAEAISVPNITTGTLNENNVIGVKVNPDAVYGSLMNKRPFYATVRNETEIVSSPKVQSISPNAISVPNITAGNIDEQIVGVKVIGIQGPKGAKGDKGDQGEKGEKGDQGEQGLPGDATIDDGSISTITVWSSSKTNTEIQNAVNTAVTNIETAISDSKVVYAFTALVWVEVIPSELYTIDVTHNFGVIPTSVRVEDSTGEEVEVGNISLDLNTIRLDSSEPFAGIVYISKL